MAEAACRVGGELFLTRRWRPSLLDAAERLFLGPLQSAEDDPGWIYMFWDIWLVGPRKLDERDAQRTAEILARILEHPNRFCRRAAIHGLGHLRHRDSEVTLRRFAGATDDAELRELALKAAARRLQ